jgi:hypothetical protein
VELREDPDLRDLPVCLVADGQGMTGPLLDRPDLPAPEGYVEKPVTERRLLSAVLTIPGLMDMQDEGGTSA